MGPAPEVMSVYNLAVLHIAAFRLGHLMAHELMQSHADSGPAFMIVLVIVANIEKEVAVIITLVSLLSAVRIYIPFLLIAYWLIPKLALFHYSLNIAKA